MIKMKMNVRRMMIVATEQPLDGGSYNFIHQVIVIVIDKR